MAKVVGTLVVLLAGLAHVSGPVQKLRDCGTDWRVWRGGASSCGIAGTSILGGGGGAGGGGLNCEAPGSNVCAGAAFAATSASVNAQIKIDRRFMRGMS